ncbi:hypothetical protein BH23ACT5_BH23ACT5_03200 [soil metagenome]
MRFKRSAAVALAAWAVAGCVDRVPEGASGREIYLEVCARCHAPDLSGGIGPAIGPGSVSAGHPPEFLESVIVEGRGRMPSFAQTLSDAQIATVVDYIRREQE